MIVKEYFMENLELIERVKTYCGYRSDAALARALGISPQNFNSQKKTGGINDSLMLHAMDKGASKEWLLTGKGDRNASSAPPASFSFSPSSPSSDSLMADLVRTQANSIVEMQRAINRLHEMIIDLGGEIGDIKNRMIDTAMTGDIQRLGAVSGKGK